jgi:hypothetical protein
MLIEFLSSDVPIGFKEKISKSNWKEAMDRLEKEIRIDGTEQSGDVLEGNSWLDALLDY